MNIILFSESEINKPLPATDSRYEHILNILKLKNGDCFNAGIINKARGAAIITGITENALSFQFKPNSQADKLLPIHLIIGACRPCAMGRIIRETTTLGVSSITVVKAHKSQESYMQSSVLKEDKLKKLLIDGAQQAFSTQIPRVFVKTEWAQVFEEHNEPEPKSCFVLDNYEAWNSLSGVDCKENKNDQKIFLIVGPEQGWSSSERVLFRAKGYGLYELGTRVLRTDTACLVGLGILISGLNS